MAALLLAGGCARPIQEAPAPDTEWVSYGNAGGAKYSPLTQIDGGNLQRLRIAWRWSSPDNDVMAKRPGLRPFIFESTPLMVGGVLYVATSFGMAAALDPATGQTKWVYDPQSYRNPAPANVGFTNRGLAYWSDGADKRVFLMTGDAYLISLDAETGRPDPGFGESGSIDLTQDLLRPVERRQYGSTSPPAVCRDVVAVGSSIPDLAIEKNAPPGDVRGFDARTGKLLWTFHSVPQKGEIGNDTWEGESWKWTGHTNVWTAISADQELGIFYLPFGTPTNDYWGGQRPGDNLFGESLVALDAETGERRWHYQITHHGLWDYDLPAPPVLAEVVVEGKPIKAAVQVTKQGFCFVFDRVSGQPVWPIEERPVPPSKLPGEHTSPTQPFPTRPAPFDRQGLSLDDLIDFTPELRREAEEIVSAYEYGPIYTPPTERGTVNMPGNSGGAYWAGAAFDPETGLLFVPSISTPYIITVKKQEPGADFDYKVNRQAGIRLLGPRGLPVIKPPYSRVTAIDLNTGEHRWMTPIGEGPTDHPLLRDLDLPPLGSGGRPTVLSTGSLLFVGEGHSTRKLYAGIKRIPVKDCCNNRPRFMALDKETGDLLWETELPSHPNGSPMTYAVGGKQYIVVAIGGVDDPAELVAFSLE